MLRLTSVFILAALACAATPALAQDDPAFRESFFLVPFEGPDRTAAQLCHSAIRSPLLTSGAFVERSSPEVAALMSECATDIGSPSFTQDCVLAVANSQVDLLITMAITEIDDEVFHFEANVWQPALHAGVWSRAVIVEADSASQAALDACDALSSSFVSDWVGEGPDNNVSVPSNTPTEQACGASVDAGPGTSVSARWTYEYDALGNRVGERLDSNANGLTDLEISRTFDENGMLFAVEHDFDGDGDADAQETYSYVNGVLAEVRYDDDGDGVIDRTSTNRNAGGQLQSVDMDTDGDGLVDSEIRMSYDVAGTLADETSRRGGVDINVMRYAYNSNGQIRRRDQDVGADGDTDNTWTTTYSGSRVEAELFDRGNDGSVDQRTIYNYSCD